MLCVLTYSGTGLAIVVDTLPLLLCTFFLAVATAWVVPTSTITVNSKVIV